MVIKEKKQAEERPEGQSEDEARKNGDRPVAADAPYLGRSARVVGDWKPVEASSSPHEKNKRGELGKPLFNWYINRVSTDPLGRLGIFNSAHDRRSILTNVIGQAPKGTVNPQKAEVTDPKAMTQHIKKVAEFLGADVVGIAAIHPSMLFSGARSPDEGMGYDGRAGGHLSPEELARKYPFAIILPVAWDYKMGQAHRHRIGDNAYHFSQQKQYATYANVVAYIRELGYSAIQGRLHAIPASLAAGIGELGRNGMLITEKFGSRVHMGAPILTDLPLVPGKPMDIGVEDFCKICRKCATACPTNSITMEGKVEHNGVEKYKINWETCYRLRPYVMHLWEICLSCVTVCPYTKPKTWWHTLAVSSLKWTPIALRAPVVVGLKFLDDVFWGKLPTKRVKWLSYDSGIPPVKREDAAATDGPAPQNADPNGKVGYYYPLKENARRFEIAKQRERRAK